MVKKEIGHTFLKTLISSLPDKPGVYEYLDKTGEILYIGKAKNLKKRVASYFNKKLDGKTEAMIGKVADIRHFVVETESDALLLENSLVKKHQPRYNIMLKDDKTFPWICIKIERFPRVFLTRNVIEDGSQYFGPYTSVHTVRTLLELIRTLYPIRTCSFVLSEENVEKKKFKLCLEFHLGNCKGPCEGLQKETDYNQSIDHIREVLKGNIQNVIKILNNLMIRASEEYRFEEAALLKKKIDSLKKFQAKSTIVNPSIRHTDVYSIVSDEKRAYVNFVKVVQGAIVQTYTIEIKKKLDETNADLLMMAITDLRQRIGSDAREVLVPFPLEYKMKDVHFHVPEKGDKKKLLQLSERNARYFQAEKESREETKTKEERASRILKTVQKDLIIKQLPVHIECFDNSNIQGKYPVAACVVFRSGRPSKKDYRHFNIKTVKGPDDYASMEEVVFRRYRRMIEEGSPLPQLVIIDGGKGQLGAAVKSLQQLGIYGRVAVIGIAKRLEEIYYPGDSLPLYIDKQSETLKLIQQIRNEAHRFGISFHRLKRDNDFIRSEIEEIKGFGEDALKKLFKSFDSVEAMKQASLQELTEVVGESKAQRLQEYFRLKDGLKE